MTKIAALAVLALVLAGRTAQPEAELAGDPLLAQALEQNWRDFSGRYPSVERPEVEMVAVMDLEEYPPQLVACVREEGFPEATTDPMGGLGCEGSQLDAYELAMYICRARYPLDPKYYEPLNDEQLGKLYDYYVTELVPCLEEEGYSTPPAPSRQSFVDNYLTEPWVVYDDVPDSLSESAWYRLNEVCPQVTYTLWDWLAATALSAYRVTMAAIDVALVERLIAAQFPQWSSLPVTKVEPGGIDNRTFRLGDQLAVRLPSAEGYVAAVAKEQRWLPALAPQLPVPIPAPVAAGVPGEGYPWPWSVNRWLEGQTLLDAAEVDRRGLARDLAEFLRALHALDAANGPAAGAHSFYRGASLRHYDAETRESIAVLRARLDADEALRVWERALLSEWDRDPVWFHGDLAPGNLLMHDGRLSGVIDFGTSGVGDPSCELPIAWTWFRGDERQLLRDELGFDDETWHRGRAWALWKALITEVAVEGASMRVIEEVLADGVV